MQKYQIFLALFAAAVILYFLGILVPSLIHRKVNDSDKKAFQTEKLLNGPATERIRCVDDNVDALLWRFRLIGAARDSLILSTFELREDESGIAVMSALYHAAERGVKVKLFIDGIYGYLDLRKSAAFHALLSHPNIEVKFYNPVNLLAPWRLNFSMHDKYVIADDYVYLLGGRNTYNYFLGAYPGRKNVDRELLVYETDPSGKDTSLSQLLSYFTSIWSLPCCKKIRPKRDSRKIREAREMLLTTWKELQEQYPSGFEPVDFTAETAAADSVQLLSGPQQPFCREPLIFYQLCELMKNRKKVLLQTPYIICGKKMYEDLTDVCAHTGSFSLLINAVENGANPWGCTDYLNQKNKILKTGSTVCEYIGDRSVHTKTILIDEDISIIGSYNLDMRSTYLDTEMMLVVVSRDLNDKLRKIADRQIQQCRRVSPDGTVENGPGYEPRPLPAQKKHLYSFLRIITRLEPVRALL